MVRLRHWAAETVIIGLIIVTAIMSQLGFGKVTQVIHNINGVFLTCFLATSLLLALVLTWKWQLVLHSQGMHVPFGRLFAYRLVGYSVGYLTPTMHAGSEPIRGFLLKREGIPTDKAFANVIIDKSVELITNVVFFFIGALLIANSVLVNKQMKIFTLTISLLLMLLMGGFVAGILNKNSMFVGIFRFFRLNKIKRLRSIEKNLRDVEKNIETFYRKKKEYFLILIGVMILLWVLMYFEYRFVLLALGQEAHIVQIFLILTGVGLAYSIPIPAALGTLELGQLSAAKVLQLSSFMGIALAFLIRARDLIWTALGLGFMGFYHFSFRRLARQTHAIDKEFERGKLFKTK